MTTWQNLQPQLEPGMTRAGRGYFTTQVVLWALFGVGVGLLLLLIWLTFDPRHHGSDAAQMISLSAGPFAVAGIVGLLVNVFVIPRERRYEERFQSARHGEPSTIPLAVNQPAPDGTALALPITIQLRPRWPNLMLVGVLASMMMGLAIAVLAMASGLFAVANGVFSFADLGGLAAALGSAFAILCFVITFTFGPETLSVSEVGVSVSKRYGPNQTIGWDDVRLFAIATDSGGKRNPKTVVYTLAGPEAFVMWPFIRRMAWDIYNRPTIPFQEYDRQMAAVLSLIAAHNGLPLYDLR